MAEKKSENEKRKQKSAEGREARSAYKKRKDWVIGKELEKLDSYNKIFLVETHDGWFKIFEKSAVIFKYALTPELRKIYKYHDMRDPNLLLDNDNGGSASKHGAISFRQKKRPVELLTALGAKVIFDQRGVTIFELAKPIKQKELESMIDEEKARWEKANKVLLPKVSLPKLGQRLRLTTKELYDDARKLDKSMKILMSDRMVGTLVELNEGYLLVERGKMDILEWLETALEKLDTLDAEMMLMFDLRVVTAERAFVMAEAVFNLREEFERVERVQKKKANKENG